MKGVGRAAGPPLRAEPAKLRSGIRGPFGVILEEVGGEDCALELFDSSLCRCETLCSVGHQLSHFLHAKGRCNKHMARKAKECISPALKHQSDS